MLSSEAVLKVSSYKDIEQLLPELREGFFAHDDPRVAEGHRMPGIYTKYFHCPFVYSIEQINETHKVRKEMAEEHLKEKEYGHYLEFVEKPYRMEELIKLMMKGITINFEDVLSVWCGVENLHEYDQTIDFVLFNIKKDYPLESRLDEDVPLDEDEGGLITLYRGYNPLNNPDGKGYSYSTSKERAEWFAQRFNDDVGRVTTIKVKREDIIFTTNRRNEYEVVPNLEKVQCV